MRKTIVPIALAMLATAAAAQDVRQEDRREDRQADRLAERQMEANELEVKLAVPRNADGTINETQLVNDVKARIAASARFACAAQSTPASSGTTKVSCAPESKVSISAR